MTLLEHCDLYDEVISEEDMTVATAKHTAFIGIEGLVFLGTLHGTCIKGMPGTYLVRDSGWSIGTDALGYWLEHDDTGEVRYP
jgi:hypothetical protein